MCSPVSHILGFVDYTLTMLFNMFLYFPVSAVNWKLDLEAWSEFRILAKILHSKWYVLLIASYQEAYF